MRLLLSWGWLALACCLCSAPAGAQTVILHLRNGDRITGRLLSESTNASIAIGWARFNDFAQYELYKRNPPPLYLQDALKRKVANAHPIIERAVRDFMRWQQDAGPE